MTSQYLDRRKAQASYRPKGGIMSEGLKRAREPFRLRNALTGLALGLFSFGIYSYSISAVKQDVFDDIDEEAKALIKTGTPAGATILPTSSPSTSTSEGTSTIPSKPLPVTLTKDQEARIMENAVEAATGMSSINENGRVAEVSKDSPIPTASQEKVERPRGILQSLDGKIPWLLDAQNKTLVQDAPSIDNIGKMSKRS